MSVARAIDRRPPQSAARAMGFALTTLGFLSLEGAFYAYVQSTAPVARRSCVRDARRARDATGAMGATDAHRGLNGRDHSFGRLTVRRARGA